MNKKFEISTTTPVKNLLINAMKDKKVIYLKNLGWIYLIKWRYKNPQTGAILTPPSTSKIVFVSEGQNRECKNSHKVFFDSQGLRIQEIEIPELASCQETDVTYNVYELEKTLLFTYAMTPKHEMLAAFTKVKHFGLAKELRQEVSSLPGFIEEVYDWKDLQTPEDTDNPHPRLLKLNPI